MARAPVLLFALLVVLSGCTAPTAPGSAAASPPTVANQTPAATEPNSSSAGTAASTPDDGNRSAPVRTVGFEPSYDATEVLRRVERLRGLDATEPITVHEYDDDPGAAADLPDRFADIRQSGAKALQLYSNGTTPRRLPLGYTMPQSDGVHVYLMNASDLERYGVEQDVVLAHEFVHALQFQREIITPDRSALRDQFGRWTTDSHLVGNALVEGDAMAVMTAYHDRYHDGSYSVTQYNRTLPHAAWPNSVGGTPYYYGFVYYRALGATPDRRTTLIADPPDSTAELLHPGRDISPRPLPDEPGLLLENESMNRLSTDRVGELVVRHAFRVNGLSFDRAAEGADGWTNGRMYYYRTTNGSTGVYWTTTWENESEATEFATTWRAMLDERNATAIDGAIRVPATDTAPESYYVIRQNGPTVRIVWAPTERLVEELAAAVDYSSD